MIKKWLTLIVLIAQLQSCLKAQSDTLLEKNSVYLELFGSSGLVYNLGYERIFVQKQKIKIGAAIGLQYNHFWGEDWNNITSHINILIGKKHHFESGIGVIYYFGFSNENLFFPLRFGYRYQKSTQGLYYRVALTPLINEGYKFWGDPIYVIPWAGITIGYSF